MLRFKRNVREEKARWRESVRKKKKLDTEV